MDLEKTLGLPDERLGPKVIVRPLDQEPASARRLPTGRAYPAADEQPAKAAKPMA